MPELTKGRMLLSHNFDIVQADVPALGREAFAQVMVDGLSPHSDLACTPIDNPHWIVEVQFALTVRSPHQVGELCAQALANSRLAHKLPNSPAFHVLALGGLKTSPALGPSPTSLQPGEWGVDVVETSSAA
jgi:hypothetical protein